jgi:hypothetical protein
VATLDLIRHAAEKQKRTQHGVWSAFGQPYAPLGVPIVVRAKFDFHEFNKRLQKSNASEQKYEKPVRKVPSSHQTIVSVNPITVNRITTAIIPQLWSTNRAPRSVTLLARSTGCGHRLGSRMRRSASPLWCVQSLSSGITTADAYPLGSRMHLSESPLFLL